MKVTDANVRSGIGMLIEFWKVPKALDIRASISGMGKSEDEISAEDSVLPAFIPLRLSM